jgi:S-adenosylmethionine:tRNA ribosyltransferase-isomerase
MMDPKNLLIKEFDYHLPDEKIAKYPVGERDASKLLIYRNASISDDVFSNLAAHLPADSLLFFNNTKVVEARLLFKKPSGTTIEIFCLEPVEPHTDITSAMLATSPVQWTCLVGNAKKWKEEPLSKQLVIGTKEIKFSATKKAKYADVFVIEFTWDDDRLTFVEMLHAAGVIPLPPYLHREAKKEDSESYQTVYAKQPGSVAAPTAGLHFTERLMSELRQQNIQLDFVTLHVGAGTFMPVKSPTLGEHPMHAEYFEVSRKLIERLSKSLTETIVAIGTTSLRTVESLYWMGSKLVDHLKKRSARNITTSDISVGQWEPYELHICCNASDALEALLIWMNENKMEKLVAETQIIIAPPYKLKIAKALITNFHQPKSTLLLLVAAVTGNHWKKIYEYALNHDFRFLSYGDACLVFAEV